MEEEGDEEEERLENMKDPQCVTCQAVVGGGQQVPEMEFVVVKVGYLEIDFKHKGLVKYPYTFSSLIPTRPT